MTPQPPSSLTLVIPAYNEEHAVTDTLLRAVSALRELEATTELRRCEVVLVNDGSSDGTLERARNVPGVLIVTYARNRGYGRAIETGYAAGSGELLAFMDADGTCNPFFLRRLWDGMETAHAEIVLGSRLHKDSKMPWLRRLGNAFYARLLSAISGQAIHDTASGMRLLRRDLLSRIQPLPQGLSYTPAMSARCVLDPTITIHEVEMPYEERTGESKLRILRDGWVFLQVILVTAVFYTPLRIFGTATLLTLLLGLLAAGALVATGSALVTPQGVLRHSLAIAATATTLGFVFHFFSKRILPSLPTSALELGLRRIMTYPFLLAVSALCYAAGLASRLAPAVPDRWEGLLFYFAALSLFLATGVFIVGQMTHWQQPSPTREELLKDAELIRT